MTSNPDVHLWETKPENNWKFRWGGVFLLNVIVFSVYIINLYNSNAFILCGLEP